MSSDRERACEVATERKEVSGPDGGPIRVEIEAALEKIYGKPIPGEVVEVEVTGNAEMLKPETLKSDGASSLQLSPPEEERARGREASDPSSTSPYATLRPGPGA